MRSQVTVFLLTSLLPALALVPVYKVEPENGGRPGWTRGTAAGISQTVTCNFDSLVRVELFTGDHGTGSGYHLEVRDRQTGSLIARQMNLPPGPDHSWLRFTQIELLGHFLRGRQYEFRFTRAGGDSIHFYYETSNAYPYGELKDTTQRNKQSDLCMRIYGRMNRVDRRFWGVEPNYIPWDDEEILPDGRSLAEHWVERCTTAGIGALRLTLEWRYYDTAWIPKPWDRDLCPFRTLDFARSWYQDRASCELLALLVTTPKLYSSRLKNSAGAADTAVFCAPRNLWTRKPADTNYWVRYLDSLVRYADALGCSIHTWEIWNEPNDTCVLESLYSLGVTGWWRRPNRHYTGPAFSGLKGLVRLYLRMAYLADSVISSQPGHKHDRILIGSMHGADLENELYLVSGVDWLRLCYQVAEENGWGIFWNGVSVHPYHNPGRDGAAGGFDPQQFQRISDTLRRVMQTHGDYGELWITEIGWDTIGNDSLRNARSLVQTFVSAISSRASPPGGFDRVFWWLFREGPAGKCGHFPLLTYRLDSAYPSYHALHQLTANLTGRRFNQRLNFGADRDDSVRVYEFEDPVSGLRTWVGWRNQPLPDGEPSPVRVRIPARTDTLIYQPLDYDGSQPTGTLIARSDGWVEVDLTVRPVFLTEKGSISRPDLQVESVNLTPVQPRAGKPLLISFRLRNIGSRPVPAGTPGSVALYRNGVRIDTRLPLSDYAPIEPGGGREMRFRIEAVPDTWRGQNLFIVIANPDRCLVEPDFDNNAAYRGVIITPE